MRGVVQLCASHLAPTGRSGLGFGLPLPHETAEDTGGADVRRATGLSVELLPERPWWHTLAACRRVGAKLFFPPVSGRNPDHAHKLYQVAAAGFCAACPVRAECAQAGRAERSGMWGGVGPAARSHARLWRPNPLSPSPWRTWSPWRAWPWWLS